MGKVFRKLKSLLKRFEFLFVLHMKNQQQLHLIVIIKIVSGIANWILIIIFDFVTGYKNVMVKWILINNKTFWILISSLLLFLLPLLLLLYTISIHSHSLNHPHAPLFLTLWQYKYKISSSFMRRGRERDNITMKVYLFLYFLIRFHLIFSFFQFFSLYYLWVSRLY